ncbi:hypothetical protein RRG08_059259 [Elysia crispata]|uniref:Uncharacterized protein n=1 Tax=Elysia crispata TaxID=231223 RepID=A0AAE1CUF2_9GAST|nr:hypothetical protein RRG08_059259 [Elysia crispata]
MRYIQDKKKRSPGTTRRAYQASAFFVERDGGPISLFMSLDLSIFRRCVSGDESQMTPLQDCEAVERPGAHIAGLIHHLKR